MRKLAVIRDNMSQLDLKKKSAFSIFVNFEPKWTEKACTQLSLKNKTVSYTYQLTPIIWLNDAAEHFAYAPRHRYQIP